MAPVKPLGKSSTAMEALQGVDLTGQVALITGGNSGIGVETARALASAGCNVTIASRKVEAGEAVAQQLRDYGVKGKVDVVQLDLADLHSVRACADAILRQQATPLTLLVLNAGVMPPPLSRTKQGFEMQIGTNHLGHMYLTQLLLPKLKAQSQPSRVVAVSSMAHKFGTVDLDDLNFEKRKYGPWKAYGQSKLANILFAKELSRRMAEEAPQVTAVSLHPGVINTNLQRHMGILQGMFSLFGFLYKSKEQGAATTVYACSSPDLANHPGAYLSDCRIETPTEEARDMDKAARLWQLSEKLIKEAVEEEWQL